jgi:hypothetical protein
MGRTVFAVITCRNKEQIPEIHFRADDCPVANRASQDLAKADLRVGKKIVSELKRQLGWRGRGLVLCQKPIQYAFDDVIYGLVWKTNGFEDFA